MPETYVLERSGLARIFDELRARSYTLIGPTVDRGAIGYLPVSSIEDLPEGWTNAQAPGSSRLERRGDDLCFGYVVGPHSWKRYLFPEEAVIWSGRRTETGFETLPAADQPTYAFVGVRPCDLAALSVQDRVFMNGDADPMYRARREAAFIVAVDCIEPGANCFCTSMGTGPSVGRDAAFDLAFTEVMGEEGPIYFFDAGSERGRDVLDAVRDVASIATDADIAMRREATRAAAARVEKTLGTDDIYELLMSNLRNGYWEDVGARCLTCTNCTLVCPTCFCNTVEDHLSLDGAVAERTRKWDSCFSIDFSYIHGGPLRTTPEARYRQWLTHKLATWFDQFGVSGCVGCGRCITWCPVGIDLTAEVAVLRRADARQGIAVTLPEVMA